MLLAILLPLLSVAEDDTEFKDPTSLFITKEDGVRTLYGGDIRGFLNYSKIPAIVLFYASWCGHCIYFSNPYKKLRKETENWGVYLAAINCANHHNNRVCDSYYSISAYPTIYIFECQEDEKLKKRVSMRSLTTEQSVHEMRKAIAQYLVQQPKCKPVVHTLYELTTTFWDDFKHGLTTYTRMIIVIGDKPDVGLIDSISLDLKVCSEIITTFVNIHQTSLVSLFGTFAAPTIISIDVSMKIEIITTDFNDYELLRARLYETVKGSCPEISILTHLQYKSHGSPKFYDLKLPKSTGIHMEDIIGGIGMSLRQEIPRHQITVELIPIIKKFIAVITEYAYWPKAQKEFLHGLQEWVASKGENLEVTDWNAFMNSAQALSVFPLEPKWITCKGQSPYFRGFPCSLWLTFHIATVKCENPIPTLPYGSKDVLLAMRGYIINFFGCRACREHFKEISKHVADQVNTGQQGVLFLWNAHNMVNARIRLDDSADPTAPKIQFPSVDMCPDCRASADTPLSDVFNSTPGYDISPISWSTINTLNFFRNHYGPANILLPEHKSSVSNEDLFDIADEFVGALERHRRRLV